MTMNNHAIVSGPEVDRLKAAFEVAILACMEYLASEIRGVEEERDSAIKERDQALAELRALEVAKIEMAATRG